MYPFYVFNPVEKREYWDKKERKWKKFEQLGRIGLKKIVRFPNSLFPNKLWMTEHKGVRTILVPYMCRRHSDGFWICPFCGCHGNAARRDCCQEHEKHRDHLEF